MWVIWAPLGILLMIVYIVSYILLRTSGDGRPALQRLRHPSGGDLQEEYGGTGGRTSSRPAGPTPGEHGSPPPSAAHKARGAGGGAPPAP